MLPEIRTIIDISQQYLSTGMAVACRMMMVKGNFVVITQVIKLMAYSGNNTPARLHCTYITDIGLPLYLVITKAATRMPPDMIGSISFQTSGNVGAFLTVSSLIPVSLVLK